MNGNFFEDFALGQNIRHATPRTVTAGDVALYTALYGSRFVVQSSAAFAAAIGYPQAPIDDLLVFHIVFGKSVPDISLNAVANLGYAGCRFLAPVYPGDTLSAQSEVIGLRENSNRKTGVVYVRSTGLRQDGTRVLEYVRWVMVRKRDEAAVAPGDHVPKLAEALEPAALGAACPPIEQNSYDFELAGSPRRWRDYSPGEKLDHGDGMTVEEAEHQLATRLYQNTARVPPSREMVLQRTPITKKLTRYAMKGPDHSRCPIALSSSRLLPGCKSCGNRRSMTSSVIATAKMPSVSASRRALAIIAASAQRGISTQ